MVAEASIVSLHAAPEGGVPKPSVSILRVTSTGCVGDRQRDLKHHGGPTRALCIWSLEVLQALRAEGHPVQPGDVGENVLVQGVPFSDLAAGDVLELGAVHARLTEPASPCRTIAAAFTSGSFRSIDARQHPERTRWYAEVIVEGDVHPADAVVLTKAEPVAGR
ncbi:MAG: sulfurase [Euryarchaeota archaeon]|nr:sulfurase [Euryarchaeota archaeon]|tara:strand:+ start:236 stop:727 length:492 start_codon:yes stop_codon:yes gene_type:complete